MKLIVGLGNPGKKYEKTRHNMGFMVLDLFSEISKIDVDKEVFNGLLGRGRVFDQDVLLFKPTTYMNLSGESVRAFVSKYKLKPQDVYVFCDDIDLPFGKIQIEEKSKNRFVAKLVDIFLAIWYTLIV